MSAFESGLVYKTVNEIRGPLLFIQNIKDVAYDEVVRVITDPYLMYQKTMH
jgi:vacuolar-type H+-ATPase subunit B/Vma2